MKRDEYYIQKLNQDRVNILENLIPITRRQLDSTPTTSDYYRILENKIEEYSLEYEERTGHAYEPKSRNR